MSRAAHARASFYDVDCEVEVIKSAACGLLSHTRRALARCSTSRELRPRRVAHVTSKRQSRASQAHRSSAILSGALSRRPLPTRLAYQIDWRSPTTRALPTSCAAACTRFLTLFVCAYEQRRCVCRGSGGDRRLAAAAATLAAVATAAAAAAAAAAAVAAAAERLLACRLCCQILRPPPRARRARWRRRFI